MVFLKTISVFFLSENCKTILSVRWSRIFAHISKTRFATFAGILDNQAFRFDQQSENLVTKLTVAMVISLVFQNGGQNGIDGGENCSCAAFVFAVFIARPNAK